MRPAVRQPILWNKLVALVMNLLALEFLTGFEALGNNLRLELEKKTI